MVKLTDLDGVGPARSDSLAEAGYETVEDLAEADPDALASSASIPDDTALDFVVQAENLVEDETNTEREEDAPEANEPEEDPSPAELAEAEQDLSSDEEEDTNSVEAEVYELEITFGSDIHYDAYITALLHGYERRLNSHEPSANALERALDQARYEKDSVTHELTGYEINTIHSAVKQQATDYKGSNLIGYMDAANDVLEQVNSVREAELF